MSGVDAADKSNVVAQSVNDNVLITYRQYRDSCFRKLQLNEMKNVINTYFINQHLILTINTSKTLPRPDTVGWVTEDHQACKNLLQQWINSEKVGQLNKNL